MRNNFKHNKYMINNRDVKKKIEQFLYLTLLALLIGKTLAYLFLDGPIRVLLFNQSLMANFVEYFFDMSWLEYSENFAERLARHIDKFCFFIYLVATLFLISPLRRKKKALRYILIFTFILNLFLLFLTFMKNESRIGIPLELSLQTLTPFVYFIFISKVNLKYIIGLISLSTALTFIGHGLFAWGYYPVPGSFIDMTLSVFSFMSESAARIFLKIAAFLDFIIGVVALQFIFLKKRLKYITEITLIYAIFWGLITSLARYSQYVSWWVEYKGIHIYLSQVLFRVPHWAFPFILLIYYKSNKDFK